ncbi:hypothetical protein BDF20DRAFT_822456 [Mycotypha africana]|uniref:uncharacterized protein n=1 Tax=Mycotypha africana TaxID=64632 RepID=UPI002301591F|nr:uncharacterized protein BDF20DRAFT_822456 [Mycotypha africana]KAI8975410.1 hypothetical protein BDF20DRAFT_822456 [Mycotypha africana]
MGHNDTYDDLQKAELGYADDAEQAIHRMQIASNIANILAKQELIAKLGKALVMTGAPAHRIDSAMDKLSQRLEVDGSYVVLPGTIIATFNDIHTHTSDTQVIRCPRSLDIDKLEKANIIAYKTAKGQLGIEEANRQLDDIIEGPPTYGFWVTVLGYIMTSAFSACLFYNGSWTDCWISAIFGLVVGVLTFISEKMPMFANVFEMLVTIPIAIVCLAIQPHICFASVAMAAIIIPLPGYSLTCAVMELAARNLTSGVTHFVYALVYCMFLGFGLGYGCAIWKLAHPDFALDVLGACQHPLSPWWMFLNTPLATIGYGFVYGAKTRHVLEMCANSAISYAVYYFVGLYVGSNSVITPSAGAFAVGIAGNLYSRICKKLAFVPIMGGIIVLVPGSLGVKGVIHMFDGSSLNSGAEFANQVFVVALSLTMGLFTANLIVYPKGKKRAAFLGY